jgi:hypothetical protein
MFTHQIKKLAQYVGIVSESIKKPLPGWRVGLLPILNSTRIWRVVIRTPGACVCVCVFNYCICLPFSLQLPVPLSLEGGGGEGCLFEKK